MFGMKVFPGCFYLPQNNTMSSGLCPLVPNEAQDPQSKVAIFAAG